MLACAHVAAALVADNENSESSVANASGNQGSANAAAVAAAPFTITSLSALPALIAQGKSALGDYSIYFFMPFFGGMFGALAFYLVRRKDEYEPKGLGFLVVKREGEPQPEPPTNVRIEEAASINLSSPRAIGNVSEPIATN